MVRKESNQTNKQIWRQNKNHVRYMFMCGSRGGATGGPDPTENHKSIGFHSITGLDLLKNHKATKPAFNVGHYRHASETPLQWRFAGRPIITRFWWFLEPRSLRKKTKQNKKQTYQSWAPSDKTFWIRAWWFISCIWKNSYKNSYKNLWNWLCYWNLFIFDLLTPT